MNLSGWRGGCLSLFVSMCCLSVCLSVCVCVSVGVSLCRFVSVTVCVCDSLDSCLSECDFGMRIYEFSVQKMVTGTT